MCFSRALNIGWLFKSIISHSSLPYANCYIYFPRMFGTSWLLHLLALFFNSNKQFIKNKQRSKSPTATLYLWIYRSERLRYHMLFICVPTAVCRENIIYPWTNYAEATFSPRQPVLPLEQESIWGWKLPACLHCCSHSPGTGLKALVKTGPSLTVYTHFMKSVLRYT